MDGWLGTRKFVTFIVQNIRRIVMAAVESKILRERVQEELWELSDENLERVLCYMGSLPREGERDISERLVESTVRYTLDEIEKNGRFYSTEAVFDLLDKELGWK